MDDALGAEVLAELRELRERVAELEEQVADAPNVKERSTRRTALRLAGAAVVGGAASLIGAQTAAAADLVLGSTSNDAGSAETTLTSSTGGDTFNSLNSSAGTGLKGNATGGGTGVHGQMVSPTDAAYGVWGDVLGSLGYGLVGKGGQAQLRLEPQGGTTAPASGEHSSGEVLFNAGGCFACVSGGNPGTWRKLAGPATAGAFHAIEPTRVYDSRAAAPVGNVGILNGGINRTISVADKRNNAGAVVASNIVPAGATAVAVNVTVTGTTGTFGYLAVNPGGVTTADASTINWFGAGQNIANGVTLTLDSIRQLTVVCGAGGGNTHFIVDVSGYYL